MWGGTYCGICVALSSGLSLTTALTPALQVPMSVASVIGLGTLAHCIVILIVIMPVSIVVVIQRLLWAVMTRLLGIRLFFLFNNFLCAIDGVLDSGDIKTDVQFSIRGVLTSLHVDYIRYIERLRLSVADANIFVVSRMQNHERSVIADSLCPGLETCHMSGS